MYTRVDCQRTSTVKHFGALLTTFYYRRLSTYTPSLTHPYTHRDPVIALIAYRGEKGELNLSVKCDDPKDRALHSPHTSRSPCISHSNLTSPSLPFVQQPCTLLKDVFALLLHTMFSSEIVATLWFAANYLPSSLSILWLFPCWLAF